MKCSIHPTEELIEREGKYGKFSSHKWEGAWCNGKKPKPNPEEILSILNEKVDRLLGDTFTLKDRLDKMADFLKRSNLVISEPIKPSGRPIPF